MKRSALNAQYREKRADRDRQHEIHEIPRQRRKHVREAWRCAPEQRDQHERGAVGKPTQRHTGWV